MIARCYGAEGGMDKRGGLLFCCLLLMFERTLRRGDSEERRDLQPRLYSATLHNLQRGKMKSVCEERAGR